MALNASYPIVEEGQNSPHGEMFRCVYNHTIDGCYEQLVIPIGGVPYWDFLRLVSDQQPFGRSGSPIPMAPIAATAAAEAYVAATGFPITGHQDNQGVVEYAAIGVNQLEAAVEAAFTLIGMPAGVCVVANLAGSPNAMSSHWPFNFDYDACGLAKTKAQSQLDKLYMIKTRGIVQVRVDALCTNIAIGDYLEGVVGSWDLVTDAANGNEGTFIALEVAAIDNTMIWCMIVNVAY